MSVSPFTEGLQGDTLMNDRLGWFGFAVGLLFVCFFALLFHLGFQKAALDKERKPSVSGGNPVAKTAGATLQAIDGPPTQEKIDALLSGENPAAANREVALPKRKEEQRPSAEAVTVRRSLPARNVVQGGTVDMLLHVTKRDPLPPEAIIIRESLPDGWSLKEVAPGVLPPDLVPEPGTEKELEFRWLRPARFPIVLRYSVQVPADAAEKAELSGAVTWIYDNVPNTGALPVTELHILAEKGGQ